MYDPEVVYVPEPAVAVETLVGVEANKLVAGFSEVGKLARPSSEIGGALWRW